MSAAPDLVAPRVQRADVAPTLHADAGPVLIQVSPTERGGVFDYVHCLHDLWATAGVGSQILPLSKRLAAERTLDERVADYCQESGRPKHGQPCTLVLHFSGYGYGSRGLCFWLLKELETLRARRQGTLNLVIVFHELFAVGPPWRSAFWVSGAQALIASRLARMADAVWTNTDKHAAWLQANMRLGTPLHARPVFSNVGEPPAPPPLHARQSCAVVFGSAPTRQRVIEALPEMVPTLSALGVEEIVEVGSGEACATLQPLSLPTRHLGRLPPQALGVLLMSSRFALLDYEAHGLAKSGVFAAYAAHGCLVLNTSEQVHDSDALRAGRDYIALRYPAHLDLRSAHLQAIATRLHAWYHGHPLEQQAHELLALAGVALPGRV